MNKFMQYVKKVVIMNLFSVILIGQLPAGVSAKSSYIPYKMSEKSVSLLGSGYADAFPLPNLTGDYCDDLISVARSQEGYTATEENDSVYWNWAGAVGTSKNWCSEFVAWCAKSANIPDDIIPVKWSSGGYRDFYSEKGLFYTITGGCVDNGCSCNTKAAASISPYDLKCGDLLLTETNDDYSDGPDHTCIVWKIEGNTLYTIDGNVKLGRTYGSVQVRQRDLTKKADTFHAVCRPQYPVASCTISFNANGGSGSMADVIINKNSDYILPECSFTAPKGKVFDTWDKGATGTNIKITENTTIKALWKDNEKIKDKIDNKQKGSKFTKLKAGNKSLTFTWKEQTKGGIKGYEIQYSTDKNFKEDATKTVSINKAKTTSKTIKKLKSKTKYYVRIRTFTKKNGEKVYSKWSKAKKVKVK